MYSFLAGTKVYVFGPTLRLTVAVPSQWASQQGNVPITLSIQNWSHHHQILLVSPELARLGRFLLSYVLILTLQHILCSVLTVRWACRFRPMHMWSCSSSNSSHSTWWRKWLCRVYRCLSSLKDCGLSRLLRHLACGRCMTCPCPEYPHEPCLCRRELFLCVDIVKDGTPMVLLWISTP